MMYDVCIIGGGQSGLVTLKTFLETSPNCILLEKCNGCIGLFSTIQEPDSFKWSTSRYMSGFSDFPMPKTMPVWFTIRDYVTYLESYIMQFGLRPHIQYNSTVHHCSQPEDRAGEWLVEYNGTRLLCKKLIICTGLNQTAKFPEIIDGFSGQVIHTHDVYTKMTKRDWANTFSGKRVLLLGGAESAYDIGHVVTQYADTLYYSTKNYTEWFPKGGEEPEIMERIRAIDNKCLNNLYKKDALNIPTDTQLNYIEYSLPEPMSHLWHEHGRKLFYASLGWDCTNCSHQNADLCKITETPDNLFKKYVVKRTEFLLDIYEKKATVVYYPDRIEGTTVYTKEKTLEHIDIIVCATGYKKQFPFLEEDVWKGPMIKKMIPENYKNIAFIGYARPTMGSIASVAEMQGWWIQKYFTDESFRYTVRTPLFRSLDPLNLANEHINTVVIGCYYLKDLAKDLALEPNMLYLLLTDSELFWRIYTGSCHPMMYRIHGHKSYEGSRAVLMDTYVSNDNKKNQEWKYLGFFVLLHALFISFLVLCGWVTSFAASAKYKTVTWLVTVLLLLTWFYSG